MSEIHIGDGGLERRSHIPDIVRLTSEISTIIRDQNLNRLELISHGSTNNEAVKTTDSCKIGVFKTQDNTRKRKRFDITHVFITTFRAGSSAFTHRSKNRWRHPNVVLRTLASLRCAAVLSCAGSTAIRRIIETHDVHAKHRLVTPI